jgi:subtilisin family serine protease
MSVPEKVPVSTAQSTVHSGMVAGANKADASGVTKPAPEKRVKTVDRSGMFHTNTRKSHQRHVPGEILVKFKDGTIGDLIDQDAARLGKEHKKYKYKGSASGSSRISHVRHVKLRDGLTTDDAIKEAMQLPNVEYAEPNYLVHAVAVPQDPDFPLQWSLKNTGQNGGIPGADIDATLAWDITAGSTNSVVAVIDTGIAYDHPDLAANMWVNTKEIADNGIDDDNNGYIDDVFGWNFVAGDGFPYDDAFHGTHVAGIIGAVSNNGTGISGVSGKVRIMALKFLDADGTGTIDSAISAMLYACSMGAHVLNNSWSDWNYSQALQDTISEVTASGCLVVAAAANSSSETPEYPAAMNGVISVSATDNRDALASFSNYGPRIDVAAPGVSIYSTFPMTATPAMDNRGLAPEYGYLDGTSMAAPHVTGLAALVKSNNIAFTGADISRVLQQSADDLGEPGWDIYFGYGRINAQKALLMNSVPARIASPAEGTRLHGAVTVTGSASYPNMTQYQLEYGAGKAPAAWVQLISSTSPVTNGVLGSLDTTTLPDGDYVLRLTVRNSQGNAYVDRIPVLVSNARILSPKKYAEFPGGGRIVVTGDATGKNFTRYVVQAGAGLEPVAWTEIVRSTKSVTGGTLATWRTTGLARDGYYTLRLQVTYADGSVKSSAVQVYIEGSQLSGWPLRYDNTLFSSSPVAVDVDGRAGLEVVIGANPLAEPCVNIFAWNYSGMSPLGWPPSTNCAGRGLSSPAYADFDGNGVQEVVLADQWGWLSVYNEIGGEAYIPFQTQNEYSSSEAPNPTLADLDGDGDLEIIVGGATPYLNAFHVDNSTRELIPVTGWPVSVETNADGLGYVYSQAVGDLDGDGLPEVVFAAPSGKVYAVHGDGSPVSGWPVTVGYSPSPPTLGDIDNDGRLEVLVASLGTESISIFRWDGSPMPGWPQTVTAVYDGSPVLGDLDGDGDLEIVYNSWASYDNDNNIFSTVHVFHHDGTPAAGWPKNYPNNLVNNEPVIGDIDGDGFPEIVAKLNIEKNQSVYAWKFNGDLADGFPKQLLDNSDWVLSGSPLIGDINQDGYTDLVAASMIPDPAYSGQTAAVVKAWSLPGQYRPNRILWGRYRHDAYNTGRYTPPDNAAPVRPATPKGAASAEVGVSYTCTVVTSDPEMDPVRYEIEWGDGKTDSITFSAPGTARSAAHSWAVPGTYSVRVRAVDSLGASSAWSAPLKVTVSAIQRFEEGNAMFTGTWTPVSNTNASGGTYRNSASTNAYASFTFTGNEVKLIGYKGPNQGKASLSIDGGTPVIVDLYSVSPLWQSEIYSKTGLSAGAHTLKILVSGTRNSKSKGVNVAVDAFQVKY